MPIFGTRFTEVFTKRTTMSSLHTEVDQANKESLNWNGKIIEDVTGPVSATKSSNTSDFESTVHTKETVSFEFFQMRFCRILQNL